ncbi:MAG TPA: response regulator [Bryobacteraceae bacterium]|nr:response regulator [Bryobacteraceae bacterium]
MSVYPEKPRETVFVVDDDALVRRSLEVTLSLAGFRIVQFASAQHFLAQIAPDQSGCVVVDIRMPGMDGLALQEELSRRHAFMSVIIITGHADVPLAVRAMRAGAVDVLQKPISNEKLIAQIKSALAISAEKATEASLREKLSQKLKMLSDRERDVLRLVVEGYPNREIARTLAISPRTVDIHRARVMEKLDAGSLAELVRMTATIL